MSTLFVVGFGPGDEQNMTAACHHAFAASDVIVGYTAYIELVAKVYPEKRTFATAMRGEVDRCRAALDMARGGDVVAVVCSGDAGVYGMASLIYELSPKYPAVEIAIVPGITAALSGAALLGAPLSHDFAVISLSNLLTPWALIEKRLDLSAQGDFCLAIYNPSSIKRRDHLMRACDILLRHKSPATVCGIARNIGREGECCQVMTLGELRDAEVDMFTTVFVGNAQTTVIGDKMVTPRGYPID